MMLKAIQRWQTPVYKFQAQRSDLPLNSFSSGELSSCQQNHTKDATAYQDQRRKEVGFDYRSSQFLILRCFVDSWLSTCKPEGLQQQSPGSRSAPWVEKKDSLRTPTGFHKLWSCKTLSGFVCWEVTTNLGCAARPQAMLLNSFAVG